jgi:hypothetical protein
VCAQLRNDDLYADVSEKRSDELISGLNAGLSPDALLFVPQSDRSISLLELALRAANDDAAVELMQRGASTDLEEEFFGMPLLDVAAQQGLTRSVSFLIEQDPTVLVRSGGDPLRLAVGYGRTDTARVLLRQMLSVVPAEELQPVPDEALRIAVFEEVEMEFLESLIQAGADPQATPELPAAIWIAVRYCSPDQASFLLQRGVDPNPRHEDVHIAIPAFECFLSEGDDADADAREILQLLSNGGTDLCSFAGAEAALTSRAESALSDLALCARPTAALPPCEADLRAVQSEMLPLQPRRTEFQPGGSAVMELTIGPTGAVSYLSFVEWSVTPNDEFMRDYVIRSVQAWRFPPRDNACRLRRTISLEMADAE